VKQKPFIGVVGTLPTAQQNANRNIGIENINEYVEENDEIFIFKQQTAFFIQCIISKSKTLSFNYCVRASQWNKKKKTIA